MLNSVNAAPTAPQPQALRRGLLRVTMVLGALAVSALAVGLAGCSGDDPTPTRTPRPAGSPTPTPTPRGAIVFPVTPTATPTATLAPGRTPTPTATPAETGLQLSPPSSSVTLTATYESIGVVLHLGTGSSVGSPLATVAWRKVADQTWSPGHPLVYDGRDRVTQRSSVLEPNPYRDQFRGSLVGLGG